MTVQSARRLFKIIDDIKTGPDEVKAVSRDVLTFCSITSALIATLNEDKVRDIVGKDTAMVEMIRTLGCSLTNCQELLGQLESSIRRYFESGSNKPGSLVRLIYLKWSLSTKDKIRTLQVQLEATKATLCSALNAFSLYASVLIWVEI